MRLHILSDLHLEFGALRIPSTEADVVVLAGDVHVGTLGVMWAREQFPRQSVIYILGNHEFYDDSLPRLTEALRQDTKGSNIHLLEEESVEIHGYRFLGCTLWTDFALDGHVERSMAIAERYMSDYHVIRLSPENRLLRARDTAQIHRRSAAWLAKALQAGDPERTVVVVHHAPCTRSQAPRHAKNSLKPAFGSDMDRLVECSKAPLWIHGHTHWNVDYRLGASRVLSNQRAYPDEAHDGFNPALVVELPD